MLRSRFNVFCFGLLLVAALYVLPGGVLIAVDDPVTYPAESAAGTREQSGIAAVAENVAAGLGAPKAEASEIKRDAQGRSFSEDLPHKGFTYVLSIPKIAVHAEVVALGLDNGKMAVPNNFTDVGWYKFGAAPGESGNAVMGAHVDNGGSTPGVFKNLKKLTVGDTIQVMDQKGRAMTFEVAATKVYWLNETDTQDIWAADGPPQLVLITCAGKWIPSIKNYDRRLAVFAKRIQ